MRNHTLAPPPALYASSFKHTDTQTHRHTQRQPCKYTHCPECIVVVVDSRERNGHNKHSETETERERDKGGEGGRRIKQQRVGKEQEQEKRGQANASKHKQSKGKQITSKNMDIQIITMRQPETNPPNHVVAGKQNKEKGGGVLDGLATSRYRGLDTKWPKPKCAADNWRGNKEKKKVGEEQKGNCCRKKKKLGKRKQKDKAGGVHSPGMGGGARRVVSVPYLCIAAHPPTPLRFARHRKICAPLPPWLSGAPETEREMNAMGDAQ